MFYCLFFVNVVKVNSHPQNDCEDFTTEISNLNFYCSHQLFIIKNYNKVLWEILEYLYKFWWKTIAAKNYSSIVIIIFKLLNTIEENDEISWKNLLIWHPIRITFEWNNAYLNVIYNQHIRVKPNVNFLHIYTFSFMQFSTINTVSYKRGVVSKWREEMSRSW